MTGRDAWDGETSAEKANRILRLNDYANAVAACQMAFAKMAELSGKTEKEERQSWLGSRFTSVSTKT